MAVSHVFGSPPSGVAGDWTMPQDWHAFTVDDHAHWDRLAAQQAARLEPFASRKYLEGVNVLAMSTPGIPQFDELNDRLRRTTGWEVVAVPGVIPDGVFFKHLSERRFPAANFLRSTDSSDYSEEPDMFHDLFGHLPMLTDPVFADFMMAYGNAGLRAEKLGTIAFLARLYLHTVEFGLVLEDGQLRAYGAGLLSGYSETVHALTAPGVRRIKFDLARVMRTEYLFDEFQRTYFVIESFDDLLKVTAETDFQPIYRRLQGEPLLPPDAECPDDAVVSLAAKI